MSKFTFNSVEYDKEALEALDETALLTLRNEIAASMGVAAISNFKDKATGVAQTLKALEKAQTSEAPAAEGAKATKEKKAKAPKEPKGPRPTPKSALAKNIKRPTRNHFSTIKKIGEHDGTGKHGRFERWPNYTDGMTIADTIETEGTEPWDVYNWEKHKIMQVIPATDEEYAERRAAWYAKHGRVDPDLEKAQKKAAAEAKAAEAGEPEAA